MPNAANASTKNFDIASLLASEYACIAQTDFQANKDQARSTQFFGIKKTSVKEDNQ